MDIFEHLLLGTLILLKKNPHLPLAHFLEHLPQDVMFHLTSLTPTLVIEVGS